MWVWAVWLGDLGIILGWSMSGVRRGETDEQEANV